MIDRDRFFAAARARPFVGAMTAGQVAGCTVLLQEWERRALADLRWLAYMLATAKWETDHTMQPVREAYWLSEDWRQRNLWYWPYYGRGLVQLTHRANYQTMGTLLGADLVDERERALEPELATQVMFEGMLRADSHVGDFTGVALEDYFTTAKSDWLGARAIINGSDHATDIANIALDFWHALGAIAVPAVHYLAYGMWNNPDVRLVQSALQAGHFLAGFNAPDGDFGDHTRAAVVAFQRAKGLFADGIVGGVTWAALGLAA